MSGVERVCESTIFPSCPSTSPLGVVWSFLTFLPSDADIRAVIDNMGMVVENVAEVREYKE